MASTILLVLLLELCLFEFHSRGVCGEKLSKYDDLELEKELKLLKKPAIKTILTTYGENYDCVYFNKDDRHAPTKNQTIHPKKSFYHTKGNFKRPSYISESAFNNVWVNKKGCPIGTVPMRKTTKEDLIRAKLAAERYGQTNIGPLTPQEPGTHYAVVRTTNPAGSVFHGGGMATTIYNPSVKRDAQYSSSQMKIQHGLDSLEAGWTVNPSLYNDNKTRLYVYSKAGIVHCYNAFCPLFVPDGWDVAVDTVLPRISKSGGQIYTLPILISREQSTGNWILYLGSGTNMRRVGHWPKSFFSQLSEHANFIEWGSKTYSPPDIPSPEMGTGLYRFLGDTKLDAYCRKLVIVDKNDNTVDAKNTIIFEDGRNYNVFDVGIVKNFGHLMFYGGPGGAIGA